MTKSRLDQKDEVLFAYWDKKISHKIATARLRELKYEAWEIDLFLDDDHGGPEGDSYND
jgi:hypothetical protein